MDDLNLPKNIEAEMGIIACCLLDRPALIDAIDMGVVPDSFFEESHKTIFAALMDLSMEDQEPIHEIRLLDKLAEMGEDHRVGGIAYIYKIQRMVETPAHAKYFARRVLESWNQRRLIRSCREAIEACSERSAEIPEITNTLEVDVKRINDSHASKSDMIEVTEVASELKTEIEEMAKEPDKFRARVDTPLVDLNKVLDRGGFLPGQLVIIAARPSIGKSSFAMNIAERNAVDNRAPGLFFSLEMSPRDLTHRAACSRARVDSKQLQDGFLGQQGVQEYYRSLKEIQQSNIMFNKEQSMDALKICSAARQCANQAARSGDKLGFIVIDYLQLVHGTDRSLIREQQIAQMSRSFKNLAGELEIPVIALSQLNRSGEREGRKPRLSDLRESGALEQDADIVLLMHRPDQSQYNNGIYPNPNVEVIQILHAKVRNGPVGEIESTFRRNFTRFENYQRT